MRLQRRERVHDDRSQHHKGSFDDQDIRQNDSFYNPGFWRPRVAFNSNSTPITVADTCHILFLSGISNPFGIQGSANVRSTF